MSCAPSRARWKPSEESNTRDYRARYAKNEKHKNIVKESVFIANISCVRITLQRLQMWCLIIFEGRAGNVTINITLAHNVAYIYIVRQSSHGVIFLQSKASALASANSIESL